MRIRIRKDSKEVAIDDLSKLTKINDLRKRISKELNVPCERQRLLFAGKQLEDNHTLFDYDVQFNNVVLLMVRPIVVQDESETVEEPEVVNPTDNLPHEGADDKFPGALFKVGQSVDARLKDLGCWYLAEITEIIPVNGVNEIPPVPVGVHNISSVPGSCNGMTEIASIVPNGETRVTDIQPINGVDGIDPDIGSTEVKQMNRATESESVNCCMDNEVAEVQHINGVTEIDLVNGFTKIEPVNGVTGITSIDGIAASSEHLYNYKVKYTAADEELQDETLGLCDIIPRCCRLVDFANVAEGDKVMVNYNPEDAKERGYWYTLVVSKKSIGSRKKRNLTGEILRGAILEPVAGAHIEFMDEVYRLEDPMDPVLGEYDEGMDFRYNKPECVDCLDQRLSRCTSCSCKVCGIKEHLKETIMCDECDAAIHIYCLNPPLQCVPEGDYYCDECKHDVDAVVNAGKALPKSLKKSKMPSATSKGQRDWGSGMACSGRTKVCTIVNTNHFGPIPGVEVGSSWMYRLQCSEAGVHRPPVSGIHGKQSVGAFSIVLSGGYEGDRDDGEEFYYSGSGGRDLSGNKRTNVQSKDQLLTASNLALALVCNAPKNERGAKAENWRAGKPVRVVRSAKNKHSKFAPALGVRYDGIYKLVRYWPEKGPSGFIIWRYFFRRDDEVPAPWTQLGKKRIEELGLQLQYPEGKENKNETPTNSKRKRDEDVISNTTKKPKVRVYNLPPAIKDLIELDSVNKKMWRCLATSNENHQHFLQRVQDAFICVCCQDIPRKPATLPCLHNVCVGCLRRAFDSGDRRCPTCRFDLAPDYKAVTNAEFQDVLTELFPILKS